MKILFVANRMPYPPFRGDKLKIYNLAKELAKDHELHLLTIAENQEDLNAVEHLLKPIDSQTRRFIFKSVQWIYRPKIWSVMSACFGLFSHRPVQVSYFRSSSFAKKLKQILSENNFDAIHVQHLRMAQYFEKEVPSLAILDLPDAFSLYWHRRWKTADIGFEKWFRRLEFNRLSAYEKNILPLFKKVLVCSSEDQSYLNQLGINNVDLLPNGVNIQTFAPKNEVEFQKNRILFTGNMDYAPNVDAVQYFVWEILPIIVERVPEVKFIIAGQRPVKSVLDLQSNSVEVTGFIEDLAMEYAKAHVVVSPLRIGAGTQNKVLEALAMNKAVVCTHVGFKGLGIASGEGILKAENAADFAKHVISILTSDTMGDELGKAGGDHVRNTFSWRAISQLLLQHFNSLYNEKNIQ